MSMCVCLWAVLLVSVVASGLLTAGQASAASRGFKLHNESRDVLTLLDVLPVEYLKCKFVPRPRPEVGSREECTKHAYPVGFEGRPPDNAQLYPHSVHDWELKYSFNVAGGVQYAAYLFYKIMDRQTGEKRGYVVYNIETWSYSNESSCNFTTPQAALQFICTAQGTKLTLKNK